MTLQEFLRGLQNVVKTGTRAIAKAIAKHGILSTAVMVAIIALTTAVAVYKQQYEPLVVPDESTPPTRQQQPSTQNSEQQNTPIVKIDKSDEDWLKKYCHEELMKLPPAPFKYTELEEPIFQLPGEPYMVKLGIFPKEKLYEGSYACAKEYKYEREEDAYASLGLIYKFDSESLNQFHEKIDILYSESMNNEWKKMPPFDHEDVGRPFWEYGGLPAVFTRESARSDTVDIVEIQTLPKSLFIEFSFYEK